MTLSSASTSENAQRAAAAKLLLMCSVGLVVVQLSSVVIHSSVDGVIPSGIAFLALYVFALGSVAACSERSREMAICFVAVVFLFVAVLDLGLTLQFVVPGTIAELNLIPRVVIEHFGSTGLIVFKVICTALPAALLFAPPRRIRVPWIAFCLRLVPIMVLGQSALLVLWWPAAIGLF